MLEVEFSSGSVYNYFGVTERLFQAFLGAPSKGKFFAQRVRSRFPCERAEA